MKKLILPFKSLWLLIYLVFMFSAGCFAAGISGNKNEVISATIQRDLSPDDDMANIWPDSIIQGQFGNSRLTAAISSLARTKSGRALIRSYFSFKNEQYVTVDLPGARLPFDVALADIEADDNYAYGDGRWSNALEAAIAMYMGKFYFVSIPVDTINAAHPFVVDRAHGKTFDDDYYLQGIDGALTVIKLLTGSDADYAYIDKLNLEDLHKKLTDYTNQSKIITAGIFSTLNDDRGEITEILESGHVYSILGYDPDKKQVTLRNPRDEGVMLDIRTGKPMGKISRGEFFISLKEFKEHFDFISFSVPG